VNRYLGWWFNLKFGGLSECILELAPVLELERRLRRGTEFLLFFSEIFQSSSTNLSAIYGIVCREIGTFFTFYFIASIYYLFVRFERWLVLLPLNVERCLKFTCLWRTIYTYLYIILAEAYSLVILWSWKRRASDIFWNLQLVFKSKKSIF